MHHSKFITILKSFDPTEFRQFYRYLQAPLLTQSKDVLKLYDIVRKYAPTFDAPQLDRQRVFKKLYPKKEFDTNRFSILLFKLTKILDEYLIFLNYQQDEFQKKKLLTQVYGKRNLNVIFKKNTEELLAELENSTNRDSTHFYNYYFLQQNYYFNPNTPKGEKTIDVLKKSIDHLRHFFLIERLKQGIELKNRERVFSEYHNFNPDSPLLNSSFQPLIYKLLKKGFCLLETNEESIYFETKQLLVENIHQIPLKEGMNILPILLNYTIQQWPKQETKYLKETFELYKVGIQSQLIYTNNKITNNTFLNIIMIGAKLNEFDYLTQFIKENECRLNEVTKEEVRLLADSYIYYHEGNYDKTVLSLQSFKSSNLLFKINAKTQLIRAYFQLFEKDRTYYNLVISSCESFEKFLNRDSQISNQKKEAYANFIFLLKRIVKYKATLPKSPTTKSELQYSINKFTNIFSKNWLIELIDKL